MNTWFRYGTISSVSATQMKVILPKVIARGIVPPMSTLRFSRPTKWFRSLHIGQTTWINRATKMVQYVAFPLSSRLKNQPLDGDHMETQITVSYGNGSSAGQIKGTTSLGTARASHGFKGWVTVVFLDGSGNPIFNTDPRDWKVVGTVERDLSFGSKKSDRTEKWIQPIPKDTLDKVRAVSIVHYAKETALKDIYDLAKRIYECGKAVYEVYGEAVAGDGTGSPQGESSVYGPSPDPLEICFGEGLIVGKVVRSPAEIQYTRKVQYPTQIGRLDHTMQ